MILQITALYAALIGLMAVALSNYVSISRGRMKIPHGDGGNPAMALIIRRHGNLLENVPLALILMGLAEASGMPGTWLHGLGIVLIAARVIHPFGISATKPNSPLRVVGAVGTHVVMLASSVYILWLAIFG